MNTDYTEQPFNLETALEHPEWVYFRNGEKPLEWHWFDKIKHPFPIRTVSSNYSFDSHNMHGRRLSDKIDNYDLILRVPYREVWIQLYKNGTANWYFEKPLPRPIEEVVTVPVKIPAI